MLTQISLLRKHALGCPKEKYITIILIFAFITFLLLNAMSILMITAIFSLD